MEYKQTMEYKQLIRLRWAVRIVLALGVAASVAANILHAEDNPISRTIAAWPPFALLLTVELVSRIPVTRWWRGTIRIVATATIASIAGWISYWHMASVTANYGESGSSAYLLPLTVDGLIVVASISLVELAVKIRALEARTDEQPKTIAETVDQIAELLPVPVSPAAPAEPKPPVMVTRKREFAPAGRGGPQATGPSRPSPLTGKPLLEEPPKV